MYCLREPCDIMSPVSEPKTASMKTVLKAIVSLGEQVAELPTRDEFEKIVADLSEVKSDVQEVLKEVKTISKAVDKDAETIVNHGKRIIRIEDHLSLK